MSNAKIRVGRGKIDMSRGENSGTLGLTNKARLQLSKSGLKDLLEGIMEKNRKKKRKKKK